MSLSPILWKFHGSGSTPMAHITKIPHNKASLGGGLWNYVIVPYKFFRSRGGFRDFRALRGGVIPHRSTHPSTVPPRNLLNPSPRLHRFIPSFIISSCRIQGTRPPWFESCRIQGLGNQLCGVSKSPGINNLYTP